MAATIFVLTVVVLIVGSVVITACRPLPARVERMQVVPEDLIERVAERVRAEPVAVPAPAPRAAPSTPALEALGLSDELIEMVLTVHYRQVLGDPSMQKVWRRLLQQAAAVRTVAAVSGRRLS